MIPDWEKIPSDMRNDSVRKYYNIVTTKKHSLILKRLFDVVASLMLLIILSPVMLVVSILIKISSKKEKVIYKQKRITQYKKEFYIYKFRTMTSDDKVKNSITCYNDPRITKIGKILRKFRIDEFPQLINVLKGDMSFVGTRPEVIDYISCYSDEMLATLILPAGVTSICSIKFREEEKYLKDSDDIFKTYVDCILPEKMVYNLEYLENFNFFYDIKIMFMTFFKVFLR